MPTTVLTGQLSRPTPGQQFRHPRQQSEEPDNALREIAKGIAAKEQKQAVIRGMTDVLVRELGRNPEYIFVVNDEIDPDNWGRKGQTLSELWQEPKVND